MYILIPCRAHCISPSSWRQGQSLKCLFEIYSILIWMIAEENFIEHLSFTVLMYMQRNYAEGYRRYKINILYLLY